MKKDDKTKEQLIKELSVLHRRIAQLEASVVKRKSMEKVFKLSEERYRNLLENARDAIITFDLKGNIISVNKFVEEYGFKKDDLIGNSMIKFVPKKYYPKLLKELAKLVQGKPVTGELEIITPKGKRIAEYRSNPIIRRKRVGGFQTILRDITEYKHLEEELLKAQKLESLGMIAGGIAHDFNNILMGVLGNVSLAKMYAEPESKIFKILTEAEKASIRARALTRQLLTFSKGGAPLKKMVSIGEVIRDSSEFALRGSKLKCKFSIPDDLWAVEIDREQISQVIQNLVINADQATLEGGVMEVSAENVMVSKGKGIPLKEGKYVKISIEDYGIGISKEHLGKVFDPYFTTKQKGSGLGLSVCYSIIKRHNGYITVDSELGVVTTFSFYLPASEKKVSEEAVIEEGLHYGKGRVLLMDDEEIVRDAVGMMLESLGYDVGFAIDGTEAIDVYSKAMKVGKAFNVVIMDLTIPGGMGGKEAIKRLLKIDPEVKVIVSSGYSTDPIMSEYKKYGFSGLISKPYEMKTLGKVLQKVISEKE